MHTYIHTYIHTSNLRVSASALQPDTGQGYGDRSVGVVGGGHGVHFNPIGEAESEPLIVIITFRMYVCIECI